MVAEVARNVLIRAGAPRPHRLGPDSRLDDHHRDSRCHRPGRRKPLAGPGVPGYGEIEPAVNAENQRKTFARPGLEPFGLCAAGPGANLAVLIAIYRTNWLVLSGAGLYRGRHVPGPRLRRHRVSCSAPPAAPASSEEQE